MLCPSITPSEALRPSYLPSRPKTVRTRQKMTSVAPNLVKKIFFWNFSIHALANNSAGGGSQAWILQCNSMLCPYTAPSEALRPSYPAHRPKTVRTRQKSTLVAPNLVKKCHLFCRHGLQSSVLGPRVVGGLIKTVLHHSAWECHCKQIIVNY